MSVEARIESGGALTGCEVVVVTVVLVSLDLMRETELSLWLARRSCDGNAGETLRCELVLASLSSPSDDSLLLFGGRSMFE